MLPPSDQGPVTLEAVMALLRDGAMRRFRIDIEADSTVSGDESQERQDRTQFIQATTEFVVAWTPILQANPKMAKMAGDLLLFGVRGFRVGRELEESIEATIDQIEDAANNPAPPPPNPQIEVEQVKAEAAKTKAQADIEKSKLDMQATMMDHHVSMQRANMDAQMADQEFQRQQALQAQQAQQAQQAMMQPGSENV